MAGAPKIADEAPLREPAGHEWGHLRCAAQAALLREFHRRGQLSPLQTAAVVARALPNPAGRWLLRTLKHLGWLTPNIALPFDILDGPDCPPEFAGPHRSIVRLAVFGLPGQGLAARDKHRWDVYQQLCAEIMSTAVDTASLHAAAARALNHPDVRMDAALGAMIRQFIAEREAALQAARITPEQEFQAKAHESKLHTAFTGTAGRPMPTRDEVLDMFSRAQREFDRCLARFDDVGAGKVLDRLRNLRQRFPVHVAATELQRCEEQYDRLLKRAGQYRRQIQELVAQAAEAARRGEVERSAWVIRRLEAIHSLLPSLLPVTQLEAYRADILRCNREHESEEAARALREKKRQVIAKIKELAGAVHRFHELVAHGAPRDAVFARAEADYQAALAEIRSLNTEWLTGLVLELESLVEDLEDPDGVMQSQLDQFIANVRTALNRLCLEIRAWQRGRGATAATPPRPAAGEGTAAPPPA